MANLQNKQWSKESAQLSLKLANIDHDGSFSGYASLFDEVDFGKDRVAKGAFAHSLTERGTSGVRMLYQHDPSEPIGVWNTIAEDKKGLFVEGKIVAESIRGKETLQLMRAGAIDGLSIGFRTQRSHVDRKSGIRTILKADLWEISVVTFPMLPRARVNQVKSWESRPAGKSLPTIREFENWLTQDAGLSRSEARIIITKGFATLAGKQDAASNSKSVLAATIRNAAQKFQLQTESHQ